MGKAVQRSRIAAAGKPDGFDFVGNSKISSFCLIRLRTACWMVFLYLVQWSSARGLPARGVERGLGPSDGALCELAHIAGPADRGMIRLGSVPWRTSPSRGRVIMKNPFS